MGCASSIPKRYGSSRRRRVGSILEVAVFTPAIRVPLPSDLARPLRGVVPREVADRLSELRGRIVSLSRNDISNVADVMELQSAIQEYLPVLLGLTTEEYRLETLVEFKWKSLGDDGKETSLSSAWYELLSVVHMMAMLFLLQANLILIPKASDEDERMVSEDSKKDAVVLLIKASGCLDYCVHHILVYLPLEIRNRLPNELQEGVLEAISTEALAQGVEFQLGLALECEKATLPVKRRLACEVVGYLSQAHYCLTGCDTSDGYGKKLILFIRWKFLEAKAAAYYFHGLVLNKGTGSSDHISAVCCLFAADELLTESKRACLSFCLAAPVTRVPPVWGTMKHLLKRIPDTATKNSQMYGHLFEQDKDYQSLPDLPEFALSLKPDEYNLPSIDALWDNKNCQTQVQTLKAHIKDEVEEM